MGIGRGHAVAHAETASSIETVIVNSRAPEPGLMGSAFGHLTEAQIERLSHLVASTRAKTLVVLMHHPVCGWVDDKSDAPLNRFVSVKRWALLAHETSECNRVIELLRDRVPISCRKVYLCAGHHHGRTRVGCVVSGDGQPDMRCSKVAVMESCALAGTSVEEGGLHLLALRRGPDRTLDPARYVLTS
jgi:hypothetical protein